MALLLPKRYLGPILTLSLPKFAVAVNLVITNVTTGKTMTIEVPALAAALEVTLDFAAKTVIDSKGVNRSAWVSASDEALWVGNPLIEGANDLRIEAFEALETASRRTPFVPAGTVENDASTGTAAWANPENAKVQDGLYAKATLAEVSSKYLKATNFGLGPFVPTGATVKGIEFDVTLFNLVPAAAMADKAVRAVKGGAIGTTDKSNVGNWPTVLTLRTYGGPADLFGTTWTVANVIAANFGIAISAAPTGFFTVVPQIDSIAAAVTYEYLPVATAYGATADISWRTAYV